MAKTFSALRIELNAILVLSDTVDPTAGAGVVAPIGSIYVRAGTPQLWQKTGAGDTAWALIATGNPQRFIHGCDGTEGSTVTVPLPADRGNVNYIAMVTLANAPGGIYGFVVPSGSYATNEFVIETAIPVSNGDEFACYVVDLT